MLKNKGRKEIGLPFDVLNHIKNSNINLSVAVEEWYRKTYMDINPDHLKKEINNLDKQYQKEIKFREELIEKQYYEIENIFNNLTKEEKDELEYTKYLLKEKSSLNPNLNNIWHDIFNKKFNKKITLFQFNKILEKIELITQSKFDKLNIKFHKEDDVA